MPLVERRYAEALVDISVQGGAIDVFQTQFQSVVGLFNQEPDFKFFLLNPEVKAETKKEVIRRLFSDKVKNELVNFLMLLIDKGRIKFLPGIMHEFNRLADRKKNILNMTIISVAPISEAQINTIKNKYIKQYNAYSANVDVRIDKTLIGGLRVVIGDKVIDGSLKGRLESLKGLLAK